MILGPACGELMMSKDASATFHPVGYDALPGWGEDDHLAALAAFRRSCGHVMRSAVKAGRAPAAACAAAHATRTRAGARAFFEAHFTPHRVSHDSGQGLLTGYYEPVLDGSRTPTGRFRVPILRRPPDLVALIGDELRGAAGAGLTHARRTAAGPKPFATRAEIEGGALAGLGLELVHLADPVDAYFLHVQGSGRIRLTDGTSIRISYDGKNGHPYTSIGRHLIETGVIGADHMSLAVLGRWLRADAARGRTTMQRNASYVFFRELSGAEAATALGVHDIPLTPGRSLAVDASVHAIGTPVYVVSPTLRHAAPGRPLHRLMIAQDVGSAITGPERGDIYFGSGRVAGSRAGITRHPANFYVLLPTGGTPDAGTPGR